MQVIVQARKMGDYIEVTQDDGTVVESPPYFDRISLAAALHALANAVMKAPAPKPAAFEPKTEVFQK